MASDLTLSGDYAALLGDLKGRIRNAQTRAALAVNRELVLLYWHIGQRILARTEEAGVGWIAHPMKVLERSSEQMLGVLREEAGRLWLTGVDKKERREIAVSDAGDAEAGELVLAEKAGRPPRITARVTQRLAMLREKEGGVGR